MSKWKCEICGKEFNNFHAQGFDGKIYCPLCYFKKENQELKKDFEDLKSLHSIALNELNELQQENPELKKQLEEKENQQKEFIEWLEKMSKNLFEDGEYGISATYGFISSIYKEIIGDKE